MHVGVVRKTKDKSGSSNFTDIGIRGSETTDDLGHYRISGLRDGEYIVETMLAHLDFVPGETHALGLSGVMRSVLIIYSSDATRKSDAVPFKLGGGEERTGEDITIPLSKLHAISGVVTAARDGHSINSGNLEILVSGDSDPMVVAQIGKDGAFHLEGVPEGAYLLRVNNARDTKTEVLTADGNATYSSEITVHQYDKLEQPIKIEGDIPNLVLSVPDKTVSQPLPNPTASQ